MSVRAESKVEVAGLIVIAVMSWIDLVIYAIFCFKWAGILGLVGGIALVVPGYILFPFFYFNYEGIDSIFWTYIAGLLVPLALGFVVFRRESL